MLLLTTMHINESNKLLRSSPWAKLRQTALRPFTTLPTDLLPRVPHDPRVASPGGGGETLGSGFGPGRPSTVWVFRLVSFNHVSYTSLGVAVSACHADTLCYPAAWESL